HRRGGARSIRASAGGGVAGPHQADRFRHRLRQRGIRRRVYLVIQPLQPAVGREFIGRVFAICVFGGLGSLPGTIVAAYRWAWSKISPPFSSALLGRRLSRLACYWRRWRFGPPACSGGAEAP